MAVFPYADPRGKRYWVIGAGGGIGAALCRELELRGATLILSGRNEEKLRALYDEFDGAPHEILPVDVTDAAGLAAAAEKANPDAAVLLSAAYRLPEMTGALKPEDNAHIINVNLTGTFHFVSAVLPVFKKNGGGQIALCASVAGYSGLPTGQPYCATKAGMINLAESLRAEHAGTAIDVKLICPGFVKTELTDGNDFPMPMIIEAEEAGRCIADGLAKKAFEIHFPKRFTLILKFLRILPYCLYLPLAAKMTPKGKKRRYLRGVSG